MTAQKKDIPIFFDSNLHRWKYSKRFILGLLFFFAMAFGFTILSILHTSSLPELHLEKPASLLRGAPNVPDQKTSRNLMSSSISNFGTLDKFTLKNISDKVSGNANPRVIGFYVNWDDSSFSSLKNNISQMDEIMPEWLHLQGAGGSISVDDQAKQDAAMRFIKENRPGLMISPLINNFDSQKQDWDGESVSAMLSNPSARSLVIGNILNFIKENNFSGVNIDFESLPKNSQANLVIFMKELYGTFHPLGLEVSQSIPLDDPDFKAKELGNYSDFLVLMAYDEHTVYDSLSGPVASQSWYVSSIEKRLKDLPASKYVIGIGNYGYDWEDGKKNGTEVTFQDAISIARDSEGSIRIDPKSLNPTFSYYDENNVLHQVWYLDAITAFNEISAQGQHQPFGYAMWRLGSEDPSVWDIFSRRGNLNQEAADSLKKIAYGYSIDYEGKGEVLKITQTPKEGSRDIQFDPALNLITGQSVTAYPSPYVITRWGGADSKKIALTFDDGPDEKYTSQILDILKKYDARATFFVIGLNANQNPDILRRVVSEGNEIGSHTYTHPDISKISDAQFNFELDATERLLESIVERKTLLFRPPYGEDVEPETPEQMHPLLLADGLGYYTVAMDIDPSDWMKPGEDEIVNRVIQGAQNGQGNVVLLHDSGGNRDQTVAALPRIIEGLRSQGFELVTVSNLLDLPQDSVMPPASARSIFMPNLNKVTFSVFDWTGDFIHRLFFLGIVLGMLRIIFISSLAVFQWTRCRLTNRCYFTPKSYPSVSVVIPAFNEEKVIVRTVKSVLASDYPDFEIIVVDDGSKDFTFKILQDNFLSDPRVKIFTKPNEGKARTLNFGIKQSNSEIIVALDADTIFMPGTIVNLVRHFSNQKIGAVAGNAKVGNRRNMITRWQALEYITSQNLDRRAFDRLNAITVVPGAVGAWRRKAVIEAGGFSSQTLAEDADLTFSLILKGYKVLYDDEAAAYTEAPETVRNFIKQRFRWMYGTLQTVWKHKASIMKIKKGALGMVAIPNIFIFQILFPLLSPLADIALLSSVLWALWQRSQHPLDYSVAYTLKQLILYYVIFLIFDFLTAMLAFILEREKEDWELMFWILPQRFFYRQLMYYVSIKTFVIAIKGKLVGWSKFERSATVKELTG